MKLSPWFWVLIVMICGFRACYLYWASTRDLRAFEYSPWPFQHQQRHRQTISSTVIRSQSNDTVIGSSPSNMFYFAQISDLHISKYRRKGHTLHYLHFIQSILPLVKPRFVVVTGDLTDAKDVRLVTSQQYQEEWQVYRQAIEQGAPDMPWYDMRGNHDCFDLPSWQSHVNFYRTHGKSADLVESGHGLYSWQVNETYGTYRFVAMDACPKRGPSRPFNFFGYMTSRSMDRLAGALQPLTNHTFVFSHYPTTTMVFGVSSKGYRFRELARQYSVYMCGHLHRLAAGLGDALKWYDPKAESLELELGDMMVHGVYRIMAVDHDLISFIDVELPRKQLGPHPVLPLTATGNIIWPATIQPAPIVLITNPKDSRYAIPAKEPLERIKSSTHIRFLVFSNSNDLSVEIKIDGKPHKEAALKATLDSPLWTAPWDPSALDLNQVHSLEVHVTTSDGQSGSSTIAFRLDGQRDRIAGGPGEFIISSNMAIIVSIYELLYLARL
ncbi:Metallo-dependent phosphatase-like protein [Dichotomocladium elegans]|nr:Metallo-dependent phosphatase-like protein [Dichotomocladium elegans]